MTTIRTTEDFIRVMDSNPEFLEAVRSRLLTREILELPATVQRLAETLELFIETTNRRLSALESNQVQIITRLGSLETKSDSLESNQVQIITRLGALETKTDSLDTRVGSLETKVDSLIVDVGEIRGYHAQEIAKRRATLIPRRLGFRTKRILSLQEIVDIIDAADTSGIPDGDLASFEDADLLILVTDDEGAERYVTVEVSYTIYPRDVERVVRNAKFLTDWTGLPAHPAVAGIRVNWRAEPAVESGEVFFHRIPARLFRAN